MQQQKLHIELETPIERSARVLQLEGIFDLTAADISRTTIDATLPRSSEPWRIGLITGPSGSGKSTIASHAYGQAVIKAFDWGSDAQAIIDHFPAHLGVQDVIRLLSSVGFSSPPAWLRPFQHLSTGEQFRATVARALASENPLIVIDEFTSVVDRTVAQVGSRAVRKAVLRNNKQFVAVTCHDDVLPWLLPDWHLYAPTGKLTYYDNDAKKKRALHSAHAYNASITPLGTYSATITI